jgi:hypothetical protein
MPRRAGTERLLAAADLLPELVQPPLALTRELLDLNQLAVDVREPVRDVATHAGVLRDQRIQDLAVLLLDVAQDHRLLLAKRVDLDTEVAQVALGRARRERGKQRGDREETPVHQRTSFGMFTTSPAVTTNSARRLRAHAASLDPSTSGRSFP